MKTAEVVMVGLVVVFFFSFLFCFFFFANILYSLSEYTTSPLFEIYSISLLIFFPENWFLISFSFIALSSIDTRFLLNLLLKVLIKVNFSYYCSTLSKKKNRHQARRGMVCLSVRTRLSSH